MFFFFPSWCLFCALVLNQCPDQNISMVTADLPEPIQLSLVRTNIHQFLTLTRKFFCPNWSHLKISYSFTPIRNGELSTSESSTKQEDTKAQITCFVFLIRSMKSNISCTFCQLVYSAQFKCILSPKNQQMCIPNEM